MCVRGAHDLVPKLKSLFICAGPGLAGEMEEASGGIERPVAVGGGAVRRMENSSGDRTSWWCIRFPPGRKARWEVHVSVPQEPVTTDLKALPPDHLAVVAMLVANGGEWARKLGGALGAPFAGAHDEFERCFKVLFKRSVASTTMTLCLLSADDELNRLVGVMGEQLSAATGKAPSPPEASLMPETGKHASILSGNSPAKVFQISPWGCELRSTRSSCFSSSFTPLTARIFWLVSPINSNCSFSFGSRCWLSRRVLTAGSAQSARLRASAPRSWRDLSCSSLVFSASLTSDWALPKLGALVKPAQRKTGQQHARSTYSCQAGDRGAQSP